MFIEMKPISFTTNNPSFTTENLPFTTSFSFTPYSITNFISENKT
jgi:hypothetical protein